MNTKICESCEAEMKFVPAGFSRAKNRPYSAFWSCDKRKGGCGATADAAGEQAGPAAPVDDGRLAAMDGKLDQIMALLKESLA